jgi:hypothetical protein
MKKAIYIESADFFSVHAAPANLLTPRNYNPFQNSLSAISDELPAFVGFLFLLCAMHFFLCGSPHSRLPHSAFRLL